MSQTKLILDTQVNFLQRQFILNKLDDLFKDLYRFEYQEI